MCFFFHIKYCRRRIATDTRSVVHDKWSWDKLLATWFFWTKQPEKTLYFIRCDVNDSFMINKAVISYLEMVLHYNCRYHTLKIIKKIVHNHQLTIPDTTCGQAFHNFCFDECRLRLVYTRQKKITYWILYAR